MSAAAAAAPAIMAGNSELDRWIEQLKRCEPLKEHEVKVLCQKALEVLVEESNVQRVDAPVTVCESITSYGWFWDLGLGLGLSNAAGG